MEQLIVLLVIAALYILKAVFSVRDEAAQKGKQNMLPKQQEEENIEAILRSAKRKRKRRKQPKEEDNYVLVLDDDPPQPHRGTLSKELNPLGEGTRIEAAPGTLNASQIVAPSIEPTVKPELESLTGIYETTASGVVQNVQTFDAKKMLTQPDGIRQGIIWSEILKRPEW